MLGDQAAHGVGVRDDEAVEPELLAQQAVQQPVVGRRRHVVQLHIGAHDIGGAGLDRSDEGRQIEVVELGVRQVHAVVVATALGGAIAQEMLGAGQDAA
ncbi:hypothetical protein D3C87_1453010 [compost metagenome]